MANRTCCAGLQWWRGLLEEMCCNVVMCSKTKSDQQHNCHNMQAVQILTFYMPVLFGMRAFALRAHLP